ENLTRFYGVQILVSETTRAQCRQVLFLPVDRIRVRGRNRPVDVFEPLCPLQDADDALRERVVQFEAALAAYRSRQFVQAEEILRRLLDNEAGQPGGRQTLYRRYLQRIAEFNNEPPEPGWD